MREPYNSWKSMDHIIMEIIKNHRIPIEIHENHEIHRITNENHQIHENHRIS